MHVEEGVTSEVVLEMQPPVSGKGQIVDGVTRWPIEGAIVEVYTTTGGQFLQPWGDPIVTGPDGRFEATGFAPRNGRIYVRADGYVNGMFTATPNPGQPFDFSVAPLYPMRLATIELQGAGDAATEFTIKTGVSDPVAFDSDGLAVLPNMQAGELFGQVGYPDGSTVDFIRYLLCGEDWHVVWPVVEGTDLNVKVTPKAGIRDNAFLRAHIQDEGRVFWRTIALPETGEVTLTGIPGDAVSLEVLNGNQGVWATRSVALAPPGPQEVLLALGMSEERMLRVVDVAGTPLSSAMILVRCENGLAYEKQVTTGTDGIARMPLPPCETLSAMVFHATAGVCYAVEIPVSSSPDDVVEVVLDADYSIAARLLDGSEPVQGVLVFLRHVEGPFGRPFRSPDSRGEVLWTGVGEGTYSIRVGAPGYWSTEVHVDAQRGRPEPVDIQFRRRGDLELSLEDSTGSPVAGIEVRVQPLDQPGSLSHWISEDRIDAPSGLVSSLGGRVVLRGLPRGPYGVEVSGSHKTHEVEVPAGGNGTLVLRL